MIEKIKEFCKEKLHSVSPSNKRGGWFTEEESNYYDGYETALQSVLDFINEEEKKK